jgi:hypothetical protein
MDPYDNTRPAPVPDTQSEATEGTQRHNARSVQGREFVADSEAREMRQVAREAAGGTHSGETATPHPFHETGSADQPAEGKRPGILARIAG